MEQLVHLRLKSMYKAFKSGDVENIMASVGSKDESISSSGRLGDPSASAADEAAARLLEELAEEELKKDFAEKKKGGKKKKKKGKVPRGGKEGDLPETSFAEPCPHGHKNEAQLGDLIPFAGNTSGLASVSSELETSENAKPTATDVANKPQAGWNIMVPRAKVSGTGGAGRKKIQPGTVNNASNLNFKLKSSDLTDYCKAVLGGLSTTEAEVRRRFHGHMDEDVMDLLVTAHNSGGGPQTQHDLARTVSACAEMAGLALPNSSVVSTPTASNSNASGVSGAVQVVTIASGRSSRKGKVPRSRRDSDLSAEPESLKEENLATGSISFMDDPLEAKLKDAVANKSLTEIQEVLDDARGVPGLATLRKSAKKHMKKISELLKAENISNAPHFRNLVGDEGSPSSANSGTSQPLKKSIESRIIPSCATSQLAQSVVLNSAGSSSGQASARVPTSSTVHRIEPGMVIDLAPGIVGWVIGRGGVRIKDIQQRSGCKMWVDQDVADEEPRKLYITGSREAMDEASSLVHGLIDTAPVTVNNANADEDVSSQIIDCPPHLVGLLIGRKGWTIKNIQMQSGAQVSINQSVREGAPRKIIVSGTVSAVDAAAEMVRDVLAYPNAIDPDKSGEEGSDNVKVTMNDSITSADTTVQISSEIAKVHIPTNTYIASNVNSGTPGNPANPWLQQAKAAVDSWTPATQQSSAPAWQASGGWAANPVISQAKGKGALMNPATCSGQNLLTSACSPAETNTNILNQALQPTPSKPPGTPSSTPATGHHISSSSIPASQEIGMSAVPGMAPVHRARSDANLEHSHFMQLLASHGQSPSQTHQRQLGGPVGPVGSHAAASFAGNFSQHPLERHKSTSISTPSLGHLSPLGELLDPSPSWVPLGQRSSTNASWQPFGAGSAIHASGNSNDMTNKYSNLEVFGASNLGLGGDITSRLGAFPLWEQETLGNLHSNVPMLSEQASLLAQGHARSAADSFVSFAGSNFLNDSGMDMTGLSRMLYGTGPEFDGQQQVLGQPHQMFAQPEQNQDKPLSTETIKTDGLANFLSQLSLGKYYDIFKENEIDMQALHLMSEADFADINIPKGPRIKIINTLQAVNRNEPQPLLSNSSLDLVGAQTLADRQCKICKEKQIDSILLNCGHMVVCSSCGNSLYASKQPCPLCRTEIERVQRILHS